MAEAVRLDTYQTLWAGRPWAVEPASAGRPISWSIVQQLRARGIGVATVTHAAGLSSTGDAAIDAALPLPERFHVPPSTARMVNEARAAGHRVVAIGTTVVRALESANEGGRAVARHAVHLTEDRSRSSATAVYRPGDGHASSW